MNRSRMTPQKRRWLDGPRWAWLCRVLGHQMNWYHWYVSSGDILGNAIVRALGWGLAGPRPSWHYHSLHCMEGRVCGRCGTPDMKNAKMLNVSAKVNTECGHIEIRNR